jgi:leucyl/phenylalanyl-tRNA--protein transferase
MIPINTLLQAYAQGLFPMAVDGRIRWFSPERRGILPIDGLHVPRRLRRVLRQGRFRATVDQAFPAVIAACAARRDDGGTWIDPELIESYTALHAAGYAHSLEVWQGERLAGGLYGVSLRGAFFGESMFHAVTDASKVALCLLVERLRQRGYRLLDLQWRTPHLATFGAREVSRREYLARLANALRVDCRFAAAPR